MASLNDTTALDWAAIIIAIFALISTIWQLRTQRKHNKLSVKPLLTLRHEWQDSIRSIYLTNCGLGPAIIFNISLTKGNENLPIETTEEIVEFADRYLDSGFYTSGEVIENNRVIEKGEEINILTISFHEQHDYNNAREKRHYSKI